MTTRFALFAALLLTVAGFTAPGAEAQSLPPPPMQVPSDPDAPDPARLQAFSLSPFYKALLKQALAHVPPQTFTMCPRLVSTSSHFTILKPIHYGDEGYPLTGLWKQAFPVSGCGPDTVLNFYFSVRSDRKIDTVIGLPGTTHADPTLQHEAQPFALAAATKAQPDKGASPCASYGVRNTKFEAFGLENPAVPDPGPTELRRPWWETWTVDGCGRTFSVPIDFTPHAGVIEVFQPGHVAQQPSLYDARPGPSVPASPQVAQVPPSPVMPTMPAPPPPAPPLPAPPSAKPPVTTTVAALPGSSQADPALQQEALTYAIAAAEDALREQGGTPCPSYTVTTKFEAYGLENPPTPDPGSAARDRPWWESWTASGCGRKFLVPLDFIPRDGVVKIVQPGHVTQPPLLDPSEMPRNPYAKDDPEPTPPPAKP